MISLRFAALALSVAAGVSAQDAGRLRFRGSAAAGSAVDLLVAGGAPSATLLAMFGLGVGSTTVGTFSTDCFDASRGVVWFDLPLNGQGAVRATLPVPADPSLVGVYLVGEAYEFLPAELRRTNCASFMIAAPPVGPELVETFDTETGHLSSIGAGAWSIPVAGVAQPGRIGGGARLGSFDHTVGTLRDGTFVFDTDDQVFPAGTTLTGAPVRVTDGVFEFLDFVVPAGITVRFEGSRPAQVLVAGDVSIEGTIDVGAPPVPRADPAALGGVGQLGGIGGPGGGDGGAGGDLPAIVGGTVDGRAGGDLRTMPGSAFAGGVAGSGGAGSPAWPPGADELRVTFGFLGLYSNEIAGGGGGGGHGAIGAPGATLQERAPGGGAGPHGAGGSAFPAGGPIGPSRSDLLVGGSGGGGAGVHPYDAVVGLPVEWTPGGAGSGGGGALLIAAGGDVRIRASGSIVADGGTVAGRTHADGRLMAPGGGGSGGTVLLQAGRTFRSEGTIRAVGGTGGIAEDLRATPGSSIAGGDGAPGRIRIEASEPPGPADLGILEPVAGPDTLGDLVDTDAVTSVASTWRRLPAGADPSGLGYELYTVQDGLPVIYSDRVGFGIGPGARGATAVAVLTRFCTLDAVGAPVPGSVGAWADGSAPSVAGANAVQFLLVFDRGLGAAADLRVETLRLTF